MSTRLIDWCRNTELTLLHELEAQRVHVDATGKGSNTERIVERRLINPYLPPHFRCSKGAVCSADAPEDQSPAIDRVIYDPARAPPLVFDEEHSLFPIETVIGLIEITLNLDAEKLREDIERMIPVKAMMRRHYHMPVPGVKTGVVGVMKKGLSPRSFLVGVPADKHWRASTIADALQRIQRDLGSPTHVHGLYVIGVGFFWTVPIECNADVAYRIRGLDGPERLFYFAAQLRQSLDLFGTPPENWTPNLQAYLPSQATIQLD